MLCFSLDNPPQKARTTCNGVDTTTTLCWYERELYGLRGLTATGTAVVEVGPWAG